MIEIVEYLQHFQRPVEIFKEHVNTGLAGLTIRGLLNAYVEKANIYYKQIEKKKAFKSFPIFKFMNKLAIY